MKNPLLHTLSALLIAGALAPTLAQAAQHDSDYGQIQEASWRGDLAALTALSRALATQADLSNNDAEANYVAAYADYRIAGAGQRNVDANRITINDALARAQRRLETLSTRATPMQAEALALLSSVYGWEISMDPVKGMTLGMKAGTTIAQAEKLDPSNPRVLLIKGIGKLFTPPLFGGSREDALQSFQAGIANLPAVRYTAVNWGLDDLYIWRGMTEQGAGEVAKARASFQQALLVAPKQAWAARMLRESAPK